MKRIGLYIHIPFCIKKCNYCDFVSIATVSLLPDYMKALIKEIQLKSDADFWVDTIYFGGGTPSILNADEICSICQSIKKHWQIQEHPEITIEINPGTLSHDKMQSWKTSGINRINLGVQSFHNRHLMQLGRIHNATDADRAIHLLKDAGFQNIGLDLMFGIFDQTINEWKKDLLQALSYYPQHLSCYSLTYEPGTPLYEQLQQNKICALPDKSVRQMMEILFQTMADHQYDHYEISNFASSVNFRSQHNQKYWQRKPYIGLGAASHSFIENKRFWNCSDVAEYIQKLFNNCNPIENCENLTIEQRIIEYIFLGLRQKEGIHFHDFKSVFSYCFKALFSVVLKELDASGYLDITSDTCRLSNHGKFFLDSICQKLVNAL